MTGLRTARPSICPALLYRDPKAAIKQLITAFGFTQSAYYESEDGTVLHAELVYGNGIVMVGSADREGAFVEAMGSGGPAGIYVLVADVDAHCARAREHGAEILAGPTDQEYGSRDYMARDVEGNVWTFGSYAPSGPEADG
ncbi:VOC family protein [Streptomyces orinoci]|uniref:VOC family protein n=1 Tax=Streptomyces orinoci TaxID=67339 RepID=A0ABV3JYJ7_STRON|nr:VOC family protein [Streptomyces orinoci]